MPEIIIERALPSHEAADALHTALKTVLGDKCTGIRTGKGLIRVDLTESATPEDHNTATQLVLKHDFSTRTTEQIARRERDEKRKAARAELKLMSGARGVAKADDAATLAKRVEWLTMEVEHLLERLGE